jgi:hypothetical protein
MWNGASWPIYRKACGVKTTGLVFWVRKIPTFKGIALKKSQPKLLGSPQNVLNNKKRQNHWIIAFLIFFR